MNLLSKKNVLHSILLFFFITIAQNAYNQQVGIGGSLLYNFQTQSFAGGLRAEIPYKRIRIVPQLTYYPSFNKISEYYFGCAIHLDVLETARWRSYLIGMLSFNRWSNFSLNPQLQAKANNWDGELGLGLTTKRCIRPFIEYRYNFKWKETNLGIGFIYTFNCKGFKKRTSISCPGH